MLPAATAYFFLFHNQGYNKIDNYQQNQNCIHDQVYFHVGFILAVKFS